MSVTTNYRAHIRSVINRNVGQTIDITKFEKKQLASSYMILLLKKGYVKRVERGCYQVIKQVRMKKRGVKKGRKSVNKQIKDVSAIPAILNSSQEGMLISKIQLTYQRITPPERQVNKNYLYRLLKFASDKGAVTSVGTFLKPKQRGLPPKLYSLTNPNITEEEWEKIASDYRLFYRYEKNKKNGRRKKVPKAFDHSKDSNKIISSFDEDRDNTNKRAVEECFIDIVSKYLKGKTTKCFAITGPDYNRHIIKLFDKIAEKTSVCEIDPHIFNIIYRKAQICPYYMDKKVSLLNCDINDVEICGYNYMDLDLMGWLQNISESILKQVKRQNESCKKRSLKFITFTASIRSDDSLNRLSKLKKLLYKGFQLVLDSFEGGPGFGKGTQMFNESSKLNFCHQHIPIISDFGKAKDLYVFTYQDTQPMMSVLVVYK